MREASVSETEWVIPEAAQPKVAEFAFDLDRTLAAVLQLRSEIPADAFTASILGTERAGNGVMIGADGLVLTIGYLITEAETIWLTANHGAAVPAYVVGYDQASGFGLVQALGRLGVPALELGVSAEAEVGDPVIVAAGGGRGHALKARDRLEARVRWLLGVHARRGAVHHAAASAVGRRRLHRPPRAGSPASARCSSRRRAPRASPPRAT